MFTEPDTGGRALKCAYRQAVTSTHSHVPCRCFTVLESGCGRMIGAERPAEACSSRRTKQREVPDSSSGGPAVRETSKLSYSLEPPSATFKSCIGSRTLRVGPGRRKGAQSAHDLCEQWHCLPGRTGEANDTYRVPLSLRHFPGFGNRVRRSRRFLGPEDLDGLMVV